MVFALLIIQPLPWIPPWVAPAAGPVRVVEEMGAVSIVRKAEAAQNAEARSTGDKANLVGRSQGHRRKNRMPSDIRRKPRLSEEGSVG